MNRKIMAIMSILFLLGLTLVYADTLTNAQSTSFYLQDGVANEEAPTTVRDGGVGVDLEMRGGAGVARRVYARINFSNVSATSISEALININVTSASGGNEMELYWCPLNNWTETTMTWDKQLGGQTVDAIGASCNSTEIFNVTGPSVGVYTVFNFTQEAQTAVASGVDALTLVWARENETIGGEVHWNSKEAASGRPFLNITFVAGAPPAGDIVYNAPSPANNQTNNTNVLFNLSCTQPTSNVTFWFDNNSDPITAVLVNETQFALFTTTATISETFFYKGSCDNGDTNSSLRNWTFDIDDPTITTDFINLTNFFSKNLTGSFNFSDNHLINSVNFTIDNITFFSQEAVNDITLNVSINQNLTALSRGNHIFAVSVADSHTAKELKGYYTVTKPGLFNTRLRYGFPDRGYVETEVQGGSINIDWESNRLIDRYTQTLTVDKDYPSITLIEKSDLPIQIVESEGLFSDKWIIIDNHWKDYVLSGEPNAKIQDITRISPYEVHVNIVGIENNLRRLQFNSVGDLNIVTQEYVINMQNVTETFTSTIFNGFSTDWFLDMFPPPGTLPNVILFFNNTNFTASVLFENVNQVRFNVSLLVNESINNTDTLFHNWFFNLSSGAYDFTDTQNQTLAEITVAACNDGTNIYPIFNMSYFNERTSAPITTRNEYDFSIFDGSFFYNQSGVFNDSFNDALCTNLNGSITPYTWILFGNILSLSKDLFATRLFEFPLATAFTIANNKTFNLSLFLIELNESSTVNYAWQTNEFQPVDGVMRISKCTANETILIESVPIIGGQASANIELLDTPYSYEVVIGTQIFREPQGFTKCHIESQTSLSFVVDISTVDIEENIGLYSVPCSLNKTGNNTVLMTWGTNADAPLTPIEGCLQAFRQDVTGLSQIYENCSTAGSIERTVPINNGFSYYVKGQLTQNTNIVYCSDIVSFLNVNTTVDQLGITAAFAIVLLIVSLALFYAGQGETQLIGAGVGILGSWFLGILAFDWTLISSIIAFLIIIIGIGRYARLR